MDVLVLNADLQPLQRVSLPHAVRMLVRQVAEIHTGDGVPIQPGTHLIPQTVRQHGVVRLVRFIVTKWRWTAGPAWSRSGVLNRDNRECGYCGGEATTVDHILPRSRGGKNTWKNTVACCYTCNQRKGHRTPDEARIRLRFPPAVPTWAHLTRR